MKKLLICCLFGNTATSLAKKMQKAANEHGYPMLVSAVGVDNFASVAPAFNCFLVAPHIQYKLDELKAILLQTRPLPLLKATLSRQWMGRKY